MAWWWAWVGPRCCTAMPPKKKGGKKKGKAPKKGDDEALAKAEAERLEKVAREEEEKKRKAAKDAERERKLTQFAEELAEREKATRAAEASLKERARKLDNEVASRSARQVKEAEAREASAEKRMRVRESELASSEARYTKASGELQMRLIEVQAREAALGDGVVGGIAERLEKMLEEQMDVRDVALSRTKQIEAARFELEAKEATLLESIAHKEVALARQEEAANARIAEKEKKLTQQDFTLKRRLGRRIKEAEALCEAHRAECAVRDRRFKAREEEIRRRSRELQLLLRKVRKHEAEVISAARENRVPNAQQQQQYALATGGQDVVAYQGDAASSVPGGPYPPPSRPQSAPGAARGGTSPGNGGLGTRPQPVLVDVSSNHAYRAAPSQPPESPGLRSAATPPRSYYRPQPVIDYPEATPPGEYAFPAQQQQQQRPQSAYSAKKKDAPPPLAYDGPANDVERARDRQAEEAAMATSDQFKALIRHVHAMEDDLVEELRSHKNVLPPEADVNAVIQQMHANNVKEENDLNAEIIEQQAQQDKARPYAARNLPPKKDTWVTEVADAPAPCPALPAQADY